MCCLRFLSRLVNIYHSFANRFYICLVNWIKSKRANISFFPDNINLSKKKTFNFSKLKLFERKKELTEFFNNRDNIWSFFTGQSKRLKHLIRCPWKEEVEEKKKRRIFFKKFWYNSRRYGVTSSWRNICAWNKWSRGKIGIGKIGGERNFSFVTKDANRPRGTTDRKLYRRLETWEYRRKGRKIRRGLHVEACLLACLVIPPGL